MQGFLRFSTTRKARQMATCTNCNSTKLVSEIRDGGATRQLKCSHCGYYQGEPVDLSRVNLKLVLMQLGNKLVEYGWDPTQLAISEDDHGPRLDCTEVARHEATERRSTVLLRVLTEMINLSPVTQQALCEIGVEWPMVGDDHHSPKLDDSFPKQNADDDAICWACGSARPCLCDDPSLAERDAFPASGDNFRTLRDHDPINLDGLSVELVSPCDSETLHKMQQLTEMKRDALRWRELGEIVTSCLGADRDDCTCYAHLADKVERLTTACSDVLSVFAGREPADVFQISAAAATVIVTKLSDALDRKETREIAVLPSGTRVRFTARAGLTSSLGAVLGIRDDGAIAIIEDGSGTLWHVHRDEILGIELANGQIVGFGADGKVDLGIANRVGPSLALRRVADAGIDVDQLFDQLRRRGPTRVYCGDQIAKSPARAKREHNASWSIVFVRNDGWSIGCDEQFASETHDLWGDDWVAALRRKGDSFEIARLSSFADSKGA